MKNLNQVMKLCFAAVILACIWSCKESVDTSARYVFTDETVLSYLSKHEDYSEYVKLLQKVSISPVSDSKVSQLLAARGAFTVFAPTNEAIQKYLEELVKDELISEPSWDAFTDADKLDSICQVITHNSIIDGGDNPVNNYFFTADFPTISGEEFVYATLKDKKLSVTHPDKNNPDILFVLDSAYVHLTERDILTTNGIIHQVNKVIAPKDITASDYITQCIEEQKGDFLVCFKVIEACGLLDTLRAVRDEVYEKKYLTNEIPDLVGMSSQYGFAEGNTGYAPRHRYYGFTIFAEPDDFWRSQGINPTDDREKLLSDLTQWILNNRQYSDEDKFVTDNNYASENHLLYQWITYHILPMRIPSDKLVFHVNEYGYVDNGKGTGKRATPSYEFYTTLGKRRLFKLIETGTVDGIFINRFPNVDNSRYGTGMEVLPCDPDKEGSRVNYESDQALLSELVNCNIYPISEPISYNDQTRDNFHRSRIRFDGMSLFPEAMNNDIRMRRGKEERDVHVYIPNTVRHYNYFENMQQNDNMNFVYYNVCVTEDWCNMYRDEMKAVGKFDVTFTLPPVPRTGTYEVRYKVLANGNRGVAQVYFGTNPNNLPVAGIPLDLTMSCKNTTQAALIGWADDDPNHDEDYDAEIDKQMRNNGYMKAPKSITCKDGSTERDRSHSENIRHIFVRQQMDPDKTYYLRLQSVLDSEKKEFYMDFLEYCPKEIYDNPETPEDIW